MPRNILLTPGPTPVPEAVREVLALPIIHHRTPQYRKIFENVSGRLKKVFLTNRTVYTLTGSGTLAMEAALVNFHAAGDELLIVEAGKFGERYTEIAKAYGLKPTVLKVPYGDTVAAQAIGDALAKNPNLKSVCLQLCETSTGVLLDIKAIGAIVREYDECVLIVDSITGIGAVECKTDEWGLDVVMTGSQKGLMLPPGLAALTVSAKAWRAYERSTLPKFYFDWMKYKKNVEKDTTPFTPAVSLVLGLNQALTMIKQEGLENTIARHSRLAEATRQGCEALGMKLFAPPEGRGSAVTPVWVPEGVDGKAIVKIMKDKYGVTIAGGQDEYTGRIFRIGHLGYFGEFDIITTLAALEMTLAELGFQFERGAGIKAAVSVFMEG